MLSWTFATSIGKGDNKSRHLGDGKIDAWNRIKAFSIVESPATTFVVPTRFEAYLDENRIFHLKELSKS